MVFQLDRLLGPRSVWPLGSGANAQEACLSLYEHALNDHEQHEEEMHPQPEPHSRADNQHPVLLQNSPQVL
jgi:hypothetical protein